MGKLVLGFVGVVLLCCVVEFSAATNGPDIIDLAQYAWKVSNNTAQYPAKVPGQVHLDLLAAGVIGDPYMDDNVDTLKWILASDWSYTTSFPALTTTKTRVMLVMDGLDTLATIQLNDCPPVYQDNMFMRGRLDVTNCLELGGSANPKQNFLNISFYSKTHAAVGVQGSCDPNTSGFCPIDCPPAIQDGFCSVNYLRTEPCSFSWDWGPAFAPVGIWKGIRLEAFDTAVLREITFDFTPQSMNEINPEDAVERERTGDELIRHTMRRKAPSDTWDVTVKVFVDGGIQDGLLSLPGAKTGERTAATRPHDEHNVTMDAASGSGTIVVTIGDVWTITIDNVNYVSGQENVVSGTASIQNPNLWMPNGFGEQNLYNVTATWTADSGETQTIKTRTGIRTVELVQDPLPGGKSYFFRLNGVPVPVHGSNWIPTDAFEGRVTRESMVPLFTALRKSHQNMLRNWGGGIYQHEFFYDLADEYGIMVWEDMMWACAEYAVPPSYLRSAAAEVQYQVRRLQRHPSIALWAGNNENEGIYVPTSPDVQYYSELYFGTVLSNISVIDQTRPMVGSSPSNGNETAAHPVCWNSQSQFFGDVHTYLYFIDCWDPDNFLKPRFTSEFGWQSWPSWITMTTYLPSDQWSFNSTLMYNRNHHWDGQPQLVMQIGMHFKLPNDALDTTGLVYEHSPPNFFRPRTHGGSDGHKFQVKGTPLPQKGQDWVKQAVDQQGGRLTPIPRDGNSKVTPYAAWLYLSQVNQAMCYKHEIEWHRTIRQTCTETVPGCNMGTMYWQNNDIWPGASWSGVDWTGRYKMVQYWAQTFYAPVRLTTFARPSVGEHDAYLVNDLFEPVNITSFVCKGMTWGGWNGAQVALPDAGYAQDASVHQIWQRNLTDLANELNCVAQDCFVVCEMTTNATDYTDVSYTFLNSSLVNSTLQDPQIRILTVEPKTGMSSVFTVTISFEYPAAFAWFESQSPGNWYENGVLLYNGTSVHTPGGTYTNSFMGNAPIDANVFMIGVDVFSLYDTADY